MIAAPFLTALLGFALFGLAADPHHRVRFGRPCPPAHRATLRVAGSVCLVIDFALAWRVWGPVTAPIGWVATLMPAAAATFAGLNLLPRTWRLPRRSRDL